MHSGRLPIRRDAGECRERAVDMLAALSVGIIKPSSWITFPLAAAALESGSLRRDRAASVSGGSDEVTGPQQIRKSSGNCAGRGRIAPSGLHPSGLLDRRQCPIPRGGSETRGSSIRVKSSGWIVPRDEEEEKGDGDVHHRSCDRDREFLRRLLRHARHARHSFMNPSTACRRSTPPPNGGARDRRGGGCEGRRGGDQRWVD